MDELYKQLPAIIEQAAKSPLGLLALMVIALAGMALVFFKEASEKTRVGIFVLLLAGVATFAVAALRVPAPGEDAAAAAPTADVTGEWTARVTYDWPNAVFDETFSFRMHGGLLIGTASFLAIPRDIADVEVTGNRLTFVTRIGEVLGDEKDEVTRLYSGEIEDENTISFVMQTDSDFQNHATLEFVAHRTGR